MRIFFDTMIFLHYKSIEELPLDDILGASPHTILMPRITLRELEKHKNAHNSSRVRERARKILKEIERWIKGEAVRPGVSMEFLPRVPAVDYQKLGLDPDWNDDLLIASVLQYQADYPDGVSVVLVTQDPGARMTASQLGLRVLELPEEYKLPAEPDPLEAENRELHRRILELQNAFPRLAVSFVGQEAPEQYARFVLPASTDSVDGEVALKVEEIKAEFPKQRIYQAVPQNRKSTPTSQIQAQLAIAPAPQEEYERYNREVDEYLKSYERYMRDTWELKRRTIPFKIEIRNTGTSPAKGVDVLLRFPEGFRLFSEEDHEDLPRIPEEPKPPKKPRTMLQIMTESISSIQHLDIAPFPNFTIPSYNYSSFAIERNQRGYNVRDHFLSIKHGDTVVLPEMFLTFDSYESADSFSCQYTIRPVNLPSPITGDLHFVIKKGSAGKE